MTVRVSDHFLRKLRIAVLAIATVILLSFAMLRHIDEYRPVGLQFLAYGIVLSIVIAEATLIQRGRTWGAWRWMGMSALFAAIFASDASLPAGAATTSADWIFGIAGWIGAILLLDRPIQFLAAFLASHEAITLSNLLASSGADRDMVLSFLAGSIGAIGFPLAGGFAATVLRRVAAKAETASQEAEAIRKKDTEEAQMHLVGQQRVAELSRSVIPLLLGLADGTLDPDSPEVRRDCGVEEIRLRWLISESDGATNKLVHPIEVCAETLIRRGVQVDMDARGDSSGLPEGVRHSLLEAPLTTLATARSHVVVTVASTAEFIVITVVGDCADEPRRPDVPDIEVATKKVGEELWLESRWAPIRSGQ